MTKILVQFKAIQLAFSLEVFTVLWMVAHAGVSLWGARFAHSPLLTDIGLDSILEWVSAAIVLWRLVSQMQSVDKKRLAQADRRAAYGVGIALSLLCIYSLLTTVFELMSGTPPDHSMPGLVLCLAAALIMPWLALAKWRIAQHIDSQALRGDAASSLTFAYLAGTEVVGYGLNVLFHLWWAEDMAVLFFMFWMARKAQGMLAESDRQISV